ncbi:MAG: DUF1178 family protein, partial [Alphaproteobacteria bacterium]
MKYLGAEVTAQGLSAMIVFDLKCWRDHVFEAWFRDSAAYEAQAKAGEIVCPLCGDTSIVKAPMAPRVSTSKKRISAEQERAGHAMRALRAMRDHVEKNFDNVGDRFAEEARKIHWGEVEKRDIYGVAT